MEEKVCYYCLEERLLDEMELFAVSVLATQSWQYR